MQANTSVKSLIPQEDAPNISVSPKEYVERAFEENPVDMEDEKSKEKYGNNSASSESTSLYKTKGKKDLPHRDPSACVVIFLSKEA